MNRGPALKATLMLLLVLASGILLGIVLDRSFLARRGSLPPGEFMSPWRMGRILHGLDLSPEQRARVDSILAERRIELHALREKVGPEIEGIRHRTEADLRAELTPEQAQRFDQNLEQIRRFGPAGRSGRHGPDGGGPGGWGPDGRRGHGPRGPGPHGPGPHGPGPEGHEEPPPGPEGGGS